MAAHRPATAAATAPVDKWTSITLGGFARLASLSGCLPVGQGAEALGAEGR
jgi:hypothetical protein